MVFFNGKDKNSDIKNTEDSEDINLKAEKNLEESDVSESNESRESESEKQDNISKDEFNKCKKDLSDIRERYYYLRAEFDNYKKRYEKERGQWVLNAQHQVLKDLLPIIDNFERALGNKEDEELSEDVKAHLRGSELILRSLIKVLSNYGVKPIEDVSKFNPEEHEAIMSVKSDKLKSGDIAEVFEKGYKSKNNVLRPAKVSVVS